MFCVGKDRFLDKLVLQNMYIHCMIITTVLRIYSDITIIYTLISFEKNTDLYSGVRSRNQMTNTNKLLNIDDFALIMQQ